MIEKVTFLEFIGFSKNQIEIHKQISFACNVDEIMIDLHDKVIAHCEDLNKIVTEKTLSTNYIQQFKNDLTQTCNLFPYRLQQDLAFIQEHNKEDIKNRYILKKT